jgi:pyruvate formate lyase activating enzyme
MAEYGQHKNLVDSEELQAGSRHDLRRDQSSEAPDADTLLEGAYGYAHSYETGSSLDGPGYRMTIFISGCMLRCQYCHNPDSWHLRDGIRTSLRHVKRRLREFAPALRSLGGGLTLSGGEPLVQVPFTQRIFAAAKDLGLHTALDTSGFLGDRATDEYLKNVDMVLLDIKSWDPETYRRVTGQDVTPTLRFAERLAAMGKPVWVRFVLVPGLTDDPANIDGVARFVAPMKNVEWVGVLPFHQLGAFKWKALGLDYPLANTPPASAELVARAVNQFRDAGCNAR